MPHEMPKPGGNPAPTQPLEASLAAIAERAVRIQDAIADGLYDTAHEAACWIEHEVDQLREAA